MKDLTNQFESKIKVPLEPVIVEFTPYEAAVMSVVLSKVGGATGGPRGVCDDLSRILGRNGYNYEKFFDSVIKGLHSIFLKDEKEKLDLTRPT